MPKVGGEKFAYDEQGMEEAQEYAQETGQDIIPSYDAGGRVERIQGYGVGGEVKSPPSESSSNPKFAGSRKGGPSPYQHEDYGEVAYEKGGKVKKKKITVGTVNKPPRAYAPKEGKQPRAYAPKEGKQPRADAPKEGGWKGGSSTRIKKPRTHKSKGKYKK
jgi:hypothetical protein